MLKSLSLFLLAAVLFTLAIPISILHFVWDLIRYTGRKRRIQAMLDDGAYVIDVLGNVVHASMLNAWFARKAGSLFGNRDEAISSALGKIWVLRRITRLGEGCVGLLDRLDPGHCWKYIQGQRPPGANPGPVARWKVALFLGVVAALIALYYTAFRWLVLA